MITLLWANRLLALAVFLSGVASGLSFVAFLAFSHARERISYFSGSVSVFFGVMLLIRMVEHGVSPALALLVAVPLFTLGFSAGYLSTALLMFMLEEPTARASAVAETDSRVAIILIGPGELARYAPLTAVQSYRQAVLQGMPTLPLWKRPFWLRQLKRRYAATLDGSPVLGLVQRIGRQLQRQHGADYRVYPSLLGYAPTPVEALLQARQDGALAIVACALQLETSPFLQQTLDELIALFPPLHHTGTLHDSPDLINRLADRITAAIAPDALDTSGVLLLGTVTESWGKGATLGEKEQCWLGRLGAALQSRGVCRDQYRTVPLVSRGGEALVEPLQELMRAGFTRILYVRALPSLEDLASILDLPNALDKVSLPPTITLIKLAPWNDGNLLAGEVSRRVLTLTQTLALPGSLSGNSPGRAGEDQTATTC